MFSIIGIVILFVMVFGGYLLAGGHLEIIMHALPHEMIVIGGAAVAAFIISNDMAGIKATAAGLGKVFKGPKWKHHDYTELLCLLFELIRVARANPVGLEAHIEDPDQSDIFAKYPKIQRDKVATGLICDTLRSGTMNYDDPHQVEEVLEKRLEEFIQHSAHPAHAIQAMADGLPALGIVAAVLGVIKTMGSIDQPPEILGGMIGGALVGTFLGVFLAYGIVGPIGARLAIVLADESHFYRLIREVLVANLHRHAPNICIEVGRQNTPGHCRPSFTDLEVALKAAKAAA